MIDNKSRVRRSIGAERESEIPRHDWTIEEIQAVHDQPFADLMFQAQSVHRRHFASGTIDCAVLSSLKTGGCSEDCAYCAQSAVSCAAIEKQAMLSNHVVLERAREAKAKGAVRFALSTAGRGVTDPAEFGCLLELIRDVRALGIEVCCTFGMLTLEQAQSLKAAGCAYYNHNLDTSPEYYARIVTTHTFEYRLSTLRLVRQAGMRVCTGGIIGMGETRRDRFELLRRLAELNPHPESVPFNMLVRIAGTPLAGVPPLDGLDFVRMIAAARVVLPQSLIRLAAGRMEMSDEMQALCFLAGAGSIFSGDKLLTTASRGSAYDRRLLERLGMTLAISQRRTEEGKA